MDRFWRTVAHRLVPLPRLARVTLEHGVCFEETFFELVSKFPSTARIRLIGSRDATIWQSYARQIPSNVTRLTLFDAGCYSIDLGIMLPRFAMLTSIDLNSPTLAMCTELANLSHRTALTRLCNPQGLEQATLGLLGKFPRLHTLAGLSLGEALDVAQVTQWRFTALQALSVFLDSVTGVSDLHALLSALPALRCLHMWVRDHMLSDTDAFLDAALPRLGELCVYRRDTDDKAADAAWELLRRRVRSDPWLDAEVG